MNSASRASAKQNSAKKTAKKADPKADKSKTPAGKSASAVEKENSSLPWQTQTTSEQIAAAEKAAAAAKLKEKKAKDAWRQQMLNNLSN